MYVGVVAVGGVVCGRAHICVSQSSLHVSCKWCQLYF